MAYTIADAFTDKKTWNGDETFSSTGNKLVDLLFFGESLKDDKATARLYAESAKSELNTDFGRSFAMMMRDPRFGLGYRDYGIILENAAGLDFDNMVLAGRYDDILKTSDRERFRRAVLYLKDKIEKGDNLAKKWMPRFGSSKKALASRIRKILGMSKQQYNKFVKVETTEKMLTEHRNDEINFSHVPSLASIKYAKRFMKDDMRERYEKYLDDVRSGKAKLNVSTTTVYDIYRNRFNIDANVFFDKLEKISLNCIPIIDVSGSMAVNDAMGKAISIGHYLSMCSSYMPGHSITFSTTPMLIDFTQDTYGDYRKQVDIIKHMDWGGSTNLKAVMDILRECDEFPEYIVILSDMEFNVGSRTSIVEFENYCKSIGSNTKLVWWNLNSLDRCAPERAGHGNVFMSGYSPMLLDFMNNGFDGNNFLKVLVENYEKKIRKR